MMSIVPLSVEVEASIRSSVRSHALSPCHLPPVKKSEGGQPLSSLLFPSPSIPARQS